MKCVDLMWVDAPALSPEHSVADASAALLRARVRSLPVIDSDRQILGMFGIHQLLALMVPRIGNMELGLRNMAFIKDDIEDLQRRLGRSTERPVGELMSTEFVSLQEDASLTEIAQTLHSGHDSLAVVSKDSGKYLGLISYWVILKAVEQAANKQ